MFERVLAQHDARMQWWREARFGMFIHWGLYAQDGCFWKGQDGKTEHMIASTTATDGGPAPLAVGGRIAVPQRLVTAQPVYPAFAKTARVQGVVEVSIVIDGNGNVTKTQIVKSIPQLDRAAIDAVRQWRYEPTRLNGVVVPVIVTVTVQFRLQR